MPSRGLLGAAAVVALVGAAVLVLRPASGDDVAPGGPASNEASEAATQRPPSSTSKQGPQAPLRQVASQVASSGAFPDEFKGTWLVRMNDEYRAKMKEAYDAQRKPGTPSFEKATAATHARQTSWTFSDGKVIARQGDEREEKDFRVKQTAPSLVVIEFSDPAAQSLEMELKRTGTDELQLRFPQSEEVPPILLVRQHG